MNLPADLKYTESHAWVRGEADGTLSVGITDHAQETLGDIVFVEPPLVGRKLNAGEACGVVESVKDSDFNRPTPSIGGCGTPVNRAFCMVERPKISRSGRAPAYRGQPCSAQHQQPAPRRAEDASVARARQALLRTR